MTTAGHSAYRPGMDRRGFLLTSLAGAVAGPLAANAQQARGIYRIGFLPFSTCSVPESFRSALNSLGYVEGRNVVIECRAAAGSNEGLSDAATELMGLKIDVMIARAHPLPGQLNGRRLRRPLSSSPLVILSVMAS